MTVFYLVDIKPEVQPRSILFIKFEVDFRYYRCMALKLSELRFLSIETGPFELNADLEPFHALTVLFNVDYVV